MKQIAALQALGDYDGKYYSKGRAGQTIGTAVRSQRGTTDAPAVSVGGTFNPLDDAALDHLTGRQNRTSPTTSAPSPGAAHQASAAEATPDHIVVLEEGTTMSQFVPVRSTASARTVAAVADLASGGTSATTPFGYVPELVDTLLKPLITTTDPSQVRALEKALTIAKGTLVKELARARNTLVGILRGAPSGTFASPEASAEDILWNACSADVEKLLMSATQSRLGRTRPAKVVDELLAQVRHRVELALIEARDMVEIAQIQAALPPGARLLGAARRTGYCVNQRFAHSSAYLPGSLGSCTSPRCTRSTAAGASRTRHASWTWASRCTSASQARMRRASSTSPWLRRFDRDHLLPAGRLRRTADRQHRVRSG
ncbi:MAG: hypothetical protein V9G09_13165 [Candidatus Nanopelagicales bacterium]